MGERDPKPLDTVPSVRTFIQARMSSSRFPGKVLATLHDKPVIDHVVERVASAMPLEQIVVATSTDPSDDPLTRHLEKSGVLVFRGPLENVLQRFQLCLETYPCTWFFRVSADSPLLDASLFPQMLAHCTREDLDIVTNVFPRTFPKGHSLEMLHSATFASLQADELDANEQEHVTLTYYNHPERFRILNISSGNPNAANQSMVVDTLEDLRRLEASPQGDQVR